VHALLAQAAQEVDAGNARQPPVEHDQVGIGGGVERTQQRFAVREAAYGKAVPFEFVTDDLAVVVVVFNEKDAEGGRFSLLVRGTCPGLKWRWTRARTLSWKPLRLHACPARPPSGRFSQATLAICKVSDPAEFLQRPAGWP